MINKHGPLGALYPKTTYIMEGDTPSFLGLIGNGLGWPASPAYGGWGGRYSLYRPYAESRRLWTNDHDSRDTLEVDGRPFTSDQATIWRWRRHFQHDFAARMDWCTAGKFGDANHNPIAVLNRDTSKQIVKLQAKVGSTITFSSGGSSDPDRDTLTSRWMIYAEAGTYRGDARLSRNEGSKTELEIPAGHDGRTIHVILTVEDDGAPPLVSYRRAIVTLGG